MGTVSTEAWVLPSATSQPKQAELIRETYTFPELTSKEVLAKPIYGCVEGNILHAIQRDPIDICSARGEESVVLGNSGVVVVERVGDEVEHIRPGDTCLVFGNGVWDAYGYPIKAMAFDAPGTMGLFAKTMKLHERQLIPLPDDSKFSLRQWAAFSLRYITAWANWRVAYECWRTQMKSVPVEEIIVCAWGGGVSFAQLTLARQFGCRAIMICSHPERIALLEAAGIDAIDRSQFSDDNFEQGILDAIAQRTDNQGISIFVDNIGTPVHRITLKALARQGVITTCGWKCGMRTPVARAIECINRHIHVHTHYACYDEGLDAVQFAQDHDWMPPHEEHVWSWDEIPKMMEEYANGRISTYFPLFAIND